MKSLFYGLTISLSLALLPVMFSPTPTPGAAQAQQRARTFESRREYLGATKESVYEAMGIRPLNTSLELERLIRDEMAALDRIAGFRTFVGVKQGGGSSSHPEAGIAVSLEQLQRIRRESGVRKFPETLRFILAHEKSHQVQYLQYTPRTVQSNVEEERRVFECQADVLAGKYLIESMGEPKPEHQAAIEDALQVAFDLGTEEYSRYSDHPSHEARRTAVRLGMASGTTVLLSRRLPDPPAAAMIESLAQKIDIRLGEMPLDWSYRVSKRITHYSRAASVDLVLADRDLQWDKRAQNPFITFSLTYENVGRKTLLIDMEVQCVSVPRDAPDDTKRWQKWSVKNFRFTVRPGQKYTARGILPWLATQELMPRLIFPPDATALVSCEYVN